MDNNYGQHALTRILDDCTGKTLHMEAVKVGLLYWYLFQTALHGTVNACCLMGNLVMRPSLLLRGLSWVFTHQAIRPCLI